MKELNFMDFEDFPRFKGKRKSKVSFYHDTEKLKVYRDNVHLEKIGKVELAEEDRIPTDTKYTNPPKEARRLKKKLKRKQRQISRKYENNKIPKGKAGENRYKFTKTKNIEKLENETRLINRRLSNIRLNHIH